MQYNNSTVNNQFVQQPRPTEQYQQSAPLPPMPEAPAEQMSFGGFADNNNDPDNSMRV